MELKAMQNEVYEWAVSKGWEPDSTRTFGDECALIHSEISEALEAYRIWKFDDATYEAAPRDDATGELIHPDVKPEGVASEFADVLIRLLHYSACGRFDVLGAEFSLIRDPIIAKTFGDQCSVMSLSVSKAFGLGVGNGKKRRYNRSMYLTHLFFLLLEYSKTNGFDLEAEYRRKMDYNYTRAYRHGNRAM